MKFRVHNEDSTDSFIVEGDTIEECREAANKGSEQRKWDKPWSDRIRE